ncbi:hypothetical protein [Mycolicibacter acidiphilus]|uniref:hypothetical protein n=1 Tax=Mycolicibacter acidiphilus TaxID=2835306 RepID=UPI002022C725|nr:hypothetical protein [Mycolicibacter acidiphilus]
MMRFDEFVQQHGIAMSPADRFGGFAVEVEGPPGWELFDSAVGCRIWICRTDPYIDTFCANAVLTKHRIKACFATVELFAMLAEQQLQSVAQCHELHRELGPAAEGPGAAGTLTMQITHELGILDSQSRSRIITEGKETLIAQLTVTALHASPVDRKNVQLSVRIDDTRQTDGAAGPTSAHGYGNAPVMRTRDGR